VSLSSGPLLGWLLETSVVPTTSAHSLIGPQIPSRFLAPYFSGDCLTCESVAYGFAGFLQLLARDVYAGVRYYLSTSWPTVFVTACGGCGANVGPGGAGHVCASGKAHFVKLPAFLC